MTNVAVNESKMVSIEEALEENLEVIEVEKDTYIDNQPGFQIDYGVTLMYKCSKVFLIWFQPQETRSGNIKYELSTDAGGFDEMADELIDDLDEYCQDIAEEQYYDDAYAVLRDAVEEFVLQRCGNKFNTDIEEHLRTGEREDLDGYRKWDEDKEAWIWYDDDGKKIRATEDVWGRLLVKCYQKDHDQCWDRWRSKYAGECDYDYECDALYNMSRYE